MTKMAHLSLLFCFSIFCVLSPSPSLATTSAWIMMTVPECRLAGAVCSTILRDSVPSSFSSSSVAQPFGRQDFWERRYRESSQDFSWYAAWEDLAPFVHDFLATPAETDSTAKTNSKSGILIPGIGNDAALLRDMVSFNDDDILTFHPAWVAAFDYAAESIAYLRRPAQGVPAAIRLDTADARDLTACYKDAQFDVVLDKGTLDAVYLAGRDSTKKADNLQQAVHELQRVLKPQGGVFVSLAGIIPHDVVDLFSNQSCWECLTDGSSLYTTDTGYTSNNLDGTLRAWRKKR